MSSTIVFVRHAHRDKPIPDDNNGLSPKGFEQTEDLVKAYKQGEIPPSKIFWSSPKIRCQQTLKPICDEASGTYKVEPLLDERLADEKSASYNGRIAKFIEKAIAEHAETIYLCSHGDILPEAIEYLTDHFVEVKKGQAVVLVQDKAKNKWRITKTFPKA